MQFPIDDIALQSTAMPKAILEVLANALPAGLLIYDAQDKILFVSSRIQLLLQISPHLLGEGVMLRDLYSAYYDSREMADPDFAQQKHSADKSAWIADNMAAHWKERCESEDRLPGKRYLRFSRRRLAGGLGICVISDITEQKRSEYQWRTDIERVQVIEEILESLSSPIFVTDQNHIYVGANRAACQFMQRPIDTIVGRSIKELHVLQLAARIEGDNNKVLESGQSRNVPERIGLPSGEEQLYVTQKVRVGKPGMHFVLSCMQDITSFATIGADGALSVSGHEQLNFVHSPANSGFKLGEGVNVVPRVLLVCSNEAKAKLAKQRLRLCGMEADYVVSQAQVLAVLDYYKRGQLPLDLVLVCDDFDPTIIFSIAAAGLFVEPISMREVEGSITDIVCTTLNVRCVQCRSGEGRPMHRKDCSLCEIPVEVPEQLSVLVAEDNPLNQVVFAQILDSLKIKHRIVATGQALVEAALSEPADMIFIDTTLPDMDGYHATALLRDAQRQEQMPAVPIIGVVALAFEGDRKKCLASGMDDMVLKPISPDIIEVLVERFGRELTHHLKINIS